MAIRDGAKKKLETKNVNATAPELRANQPSSFSHAFLNAFCLHVVACIPLFCMKAEKKQLIFDLLFFYVLCYCTIYFLRIFSMMNKKKGCPPVSRDFFFVLHLDDDDFRLSVMSSNIIVWNLLMFPVDDIHWFSVQIIQYWTSIAHNIFFVHLSQSASSELFDSFSLLSYRLAIMSAIA